MNKKPSGPPTLLLRLFVSHAAILSLAFPLHAGAQQLQDINEPTTTAFANANSPRLPVDLVDAPSAMLAPAANEAGAAGVVRAPLTREEKIQNEAERNSAC